MIPRQSKWLFALAALVPIGVAMANPLQPQVVGGTATVSGQSTPTVTVTQSTDRAIINWNTFNIGAGETTRFVQPGASSVTLNRVTGGLGASDISGTLTANGQVFLVNPNGVLFGAGARVETAGFLATTNDIRNQDFMAGRYIFNIPGRLDASIVNLGTITAHSGGFAALVAPGVRNSGTITATLGKIGLASGNGFTLDLYGDKLITLAVGDEIATTVKDVATGLPLDSLVKNEGKLRANGGRVELTAAAARKVVDSVINNTGVIEANSIGRRNGMIVLGGATASGKSAGLPAQRVRVAGTMSAQGRKRGQTGGTVQITGEEIAVSAADIDVTGSAGGGKVLIGGDWAGGAPDTALVRNASAALERYAVPTASRVTVDAATTINASALDRGNGGKAIVWSDGTTAFAGTILARGGAQSGDGGFAEVSGKQYLNFNGTADLRAPKGLWGTLLLDPQDVTISDKGDLTVAALQNQLALGNVVVSTGSGSGNGDITVAQKVTWNSASSLTLSAFRNITVNAPLVNTAGADVTLRADATGTGVGTVSFGAGVQISTAGAVSIFYNPTTTDGGPKYLDVAEDFSANVAGGAKLTAYMLVNTVDDLQNMRNNLAGVYALGRDVDASSAVRLNNGAGFEPIGAGEVVFSGIFDGQTHTISDLTIRSQLLAVGLFGALGPNGIVRNVGLQRGTVVGGAEAYVGALVGYSAGTVSRAYASADVSGGSASIVGGLVGYQDVSGSIAQSFAVGSVSVGASPATAGSQSAAGGLVGFNMGAIKQAYATGAVNGGSGSFIGGLVGVNGGSLFETYAVGPVTGGGATLGGLVATNQVIVSSSQGTPITLTGSAINSYWDLATSGISTSAGGTGLTTAQLTATLATGFDLAAWTINPDVNGGYPCLLWTCSPPGSTGSTGSSIPALPPGLLVPNQQIPGPGFPTPSTGTPPVIDIPPSLSNPTPLGPVTVGLPPTLVVTVSVNTSGNLDNTPTGSSPDGTPAGENPPDGAVVANVPQSGQPGDANSPTGSTGNTSNPGSGTGSGTGSGQGGVPPASGVPPPGENRFVRNEVLLHFQDNVSQDEIARILRRLRLVVLAAQRLEIVGRTMYRLRIPAGQTVTAIISALEATGLSIGVQPNYIYGLRQADPASQADPAGRSRTGDQDQYAFKKLGLDEVHRIVRGDNVLVALIDSEVDTSHPDLSGAIAGRFDAGCGANAAPHPHGTGMAGAIVSHGTVTGVAPAARLLTICAFGGAAANPQATTLNILKGLDWALGQGARIVNMSFAGPRDPVLGQALGVLREKNIVLIGAAGNGGPKSRPLYPGADPNVIAVTATDVADHLFARANRGSYIALAAPGVDILVPSPEGDYQLTTGTSVAAAHVSGIAALILARKPGMKANDIRTMLLSTATDLGPKGFDDQYGWGLVNPLRALNWTDPKTEAKDATSSAPRNP